VILKCYHKALLERRHHRNVRREIDTMQTATNHRRAVALSKATRAREYTQHLQLHTCCALCCAAAEAPHMQPTSPAPSVDAKLERETQRRRLPGVVPLLGSFEDDASVCLVQELCGRSDLFKRLVTSGGTIPEQELCLTVNLQHFSPPQGTDRVSPACEPLRRDQHSSSCPACINEEPPHVAIDITNTGRSWLRADHRAAAAHAGVLAQPRHRAQVRRGPCSYCRGGISKTAARLWLSREVVLPRRDIKPENIFFDDSNNLRLGDFGLAINETRERPTARVGTLDFMAPEVCRRHCSPSRSALQAQSPTMSAVIVRKRLTGGWH